MVVLKTLRGADSGRCFDLPTGATVIGRDPRCDIVLKNEAVSRQHVQVVVLESGEVFVEDLHSHNGTIVNRQQIASGPLGRVQLLNYDRLEVCGVLFAFHDESESSDAVLIQDLGVEETPSVVSSVNMSGDTTVWGDAKDLKRKLRALVQILESSDEPVIDDLLPQAIETLLETMPHAHCGFVLMHDEREDDFVCRAVRRREQGGQPIHASRTIINQAAARKAAILSREVENDELFSAAESLRGNSVNSFVCAPLLSMRNDVLGVVQLQAIDEREPFTDTDLKFLAAASRHLGVVVENALLNEKIRRREVGRMQQRFRELIDDAPYGVCIHRGSNVLIANQKAAELHGVTPQRLMEGVWPGDMVHPSDRRPVGEALERCWNTERERFNYRTAAGDGDVWLECMAQRIEWYGEPAIQCSIVDVSDQMESSPGGSTKQFDGLALHLLADFARSVSRDLAAPLRTASGFCDLLRRRSSSQLDEKSVEYLANVEDGIARTEQMVRGLLEYSEVANSNTPLQATEVSQAVEAALWPLQAKIQECEATIEREDLPIVMANPTHLAQVIQHLLDNALRFRGVRAPAIQIGSRREGDMHVISIRDNGVGIPAREQDRIFRLFERIPSAEDRSASGVGLALCKHIVERNGGRIWVDSQEGAGATFYFSLKAAD